MTERYRPATGRRNRYTSCQLQVGEYTWEGR